MNIVLLKEEDRTADDCYEISEDRVIKHINSVLKMGQGDCFSAAELNGMMGRAEILEIDNSKIAIKFHKEKNPPPKIPPVASRYLSARSLSGRALVALSTH